MKNILFPLIIILFLASCGPKYYIVADRDEQGKIISVREMTKAEKAEAMRVQKATLTYDTIPNFRLATLKKPAENYDPEDYNTFAVYTHPHTVAPLQIGCSK